MRTTTILAMAVLGCCCLVTDAFVIGSPYGINPYIQLINRRQIPRFGRQVIYNPTRAIRGKAIKSTQVKQVAPARPAPQAQKVYPPAPQAQKVYVPAPQAQKVYPPATQTQNVYPPAPQPQYVVANGLPDHYGSQIDQGYDTQPIHASNRNTLRHQPFPQNTIIIIKEDSPNPRGASAPAQAQAPLAPAPASIVIDAPTPTDPFSAAGPNFADPFNAPFPADPFFDPTTASADPFSLSNPVDPLAAPTSAPAKTAASPQVPIPEPNSPAGAASGLYPGASQRGYDALDNMLRLSMLAEMELPHYGGHHNLHQLAETLGAPASRGAAQYQASKSSSLGHQNQYDRLFSQHLAEALDLPPQQGHPASGATHNAPLANNPNVAVSQAAAAAAAPAAVKAASPAAKPAGGPHGYNPYDLYSMHLREALDLPPMPPMPRV
ncbi:vegetative cell wall protein gp1-like [Haliotis rufescens]|uniref:vegetative cell wall protein gp1-like n=1 Tax=Haliotis rufescens TaxID=6454 RepID=UPI00201EA53E|nr:vegetative cell wall protein gp1-like [Haliotis rufescens]